MKKFILYWLDGTTQTISGRDISDAIMRAGYGGGALRALDYYKELKDSD
jgi:hypothetical protein